MRARMSLIIAILLFLGVSSNALAEDISYTVNQKDCLWKIGQKFRIDHHKIKEANGLTSDVIHRGDVLKIPVSVKSKTGNGKKETEAISVTTLYLRNNGHEIISKNGRKKIELSDVRTYDEANSGRDKTRCSAAEAAWLLGLINEEEIANTKIVMVDIPSGQLLIDPNMIINEGESIRMTSGMNKVGHYTAGFQFFVQKAKIYVNGEFRSSMYRSPRCNNWIWHAEKESLVETVKVTESKDTSDQGEGIIVDKEMKKKILREHELDLGAGAWRNFDGFSKGAWWFFQYKLALRNLETNFENGTFTPEFGIFARGDLGETSAKYAWNNAGIGPEGGFSLTGFTADGYPQQIQVMFRTLWEHLHGENSITGYEKSEDHFLLGVYAEYLRRHSPELMSVLYAEGWVDVSKSISSTWKGDTASSRNGFAIGYKLHKDWDETWASRFGVQVGWIEQDNQWIANVNIEMRYNDWLIFGPSLDYTWASAISGGAGVFSGGPFMRAELKWLVRGEYAKVKSEEVQPADRELLQY